MGSREDDDYWNEKYECLAHPCDICHPEGDDEPEEDEEDE